MENFYYFVTYSRWWWFDHTFYLCIPKKLGTAECLAVFHHVNKASYGNEISIVLSVTQQHADQYLVFTSDDKWLDVPREIFIASMNEDLNQDNFKEAARIY